MVSGFFFNLVFSFTLELVGFSADEVLYKISF